MLGVPEKGEVEAIKEFQNGHGSGPRIWGGICKKRFGDHFAWAGGSFKKVYDIARDIEEPDYLRVSIMFTLDNAMIRKKNLSLLKRDFIEFDKEYPTEENFVNHLPDYINFFDEIINNPKQYEQYFAFCFIQTSVDGDAWKAAPVYTADGEYDEDTEWLNYDVSKENKHWFIFDN